MTGQRFEAVTRAEASGIVVDGRLRLADVPPISPSWFPCGVYRVPGTSIVVVDEPLSTADLQTEVGASVPDWVDVLVVCTVLTPDPDPSPVIEVELVRPSGAAAAEAAFAAACGVSDDSFTDADPVDAFVRVGGRPFRVRATRDSGSGWSGLVTDPAEEERRTGELWRLFRSSGTAFGWGGWDGDGFRWSSRSPYDVAALLPYVVLSLDDHDIAVVTDPITTEQRTALARAPLPDGVEILIAGRPTTGLDAPTVRIDAELVRPAGTDRATAAAALAAACSLSGRFEPAPGEILVQVADASLSVIIESGANDGVPWWSFRTRPG